MAKYRDGKAGFRGRENQTIRFLKLDYPIFLDQASTSTAASSSDNQSRTSPRQNSEVQNHRQQEHHPVSYFPIEPPMPRPWGSPSMMYPPCPPWAGWYRPWTPPPMHFHSGWSGPSQGFGHEGYYTGDNRYGHVSHQQGRKASGQENQTVHNAKSDHLISQEEAATPGRQQE
jgi:hypothetical protein